MTPLRQMNKDSKKTLKDCGGFNFLRFSIIATTLLFVLHTVDAGTKSINEDIKKGRMQTIKSIKKAILDAYSRGERKIVIPPATYRLKCDKRSTRHLTFSGMKNFEIDASGSTFIFENNDKGGILFKNCKNISFKGATLLRERPPFSQGDILKISPDRSFVDIKVHKGYPTDMESAFFKSSPILTIYNGKTGKLKRDILDLALRIKSIERLGNDSFRFHLNIPLDKRIPLALEDMAVWRRYVTREVFILNCSKMSFSGVTIKNACGLCVCEKGGKGGNFYSYTVTYAAPPKGATRPPLLSCAADGFNSGDVRKGPILENCLWEGMHDDAVNIHGTVSYVLESDVSGVVISSRMPKPELNDMFQFFDKDGLPQGKVRLVSFKKIRGYKISAASAKKKPLPSYVRQADAKFSRLKFDRDVQPRPGWHIVNLNACGSGYIIRNCITREHRARGFLLYSSGIVENNIVERCSYGGIVVAPTFRYFGEGPYGNNLIIRNNIIRDVGFATEYWNVGLTVNSIEEGKFTSLPGGHRNITIEGNHFENNDGPNIMISSATEVIIKDNIFINPMHKKYHGLNPPFSTDALIVITESNKVHFDGNRIVKPGRFMKMTVNISESSNISGTKEGLKISE